MYQEAHLNYSVFISYRRTNYGMARLIYERLLHTGFDVFLDYENIKVGDFGQIILQNIENRAHFLPILTPSTLERCQDPDDWVRKEIEHALNHRRNIIPIVTDKFDFNDIHTYLPAHIATPLSRYNALRLANDYTDASFDKLIEYLSIPVVRTIHPSMSTAARNYAAKQKIFVGNSPIPTRGEINAEFWFERGYALNDDSDRELDYYNQAISLKPGFAEALFNRAMLYKNRRNTAAAMRDLDTTIKADPNHADAYTNRGNLHFALGDHTAALRDYEAALHINPHDAVTHNNRGLIHMDRRDYRSALMDFDTAIRLNANYAAPYCYRAQVHHAFGDHTRALVDCERAIQLAPNDSRVYTVRGTIWADQGNTNRAIADFNMALRLDPNNENARAAREKIEGTGSKLFRRFFGE